MNHFFETLSIAPRGIRHKLTVAFALMSVLPMLVCGYLIVYYIFPAINTLWDVSLVFVISIFLMLLGFCLAKKIIYPIVEIAAHARGIAEGKLEADLRIEGQDEIGELSGSLNQLSSKLKENMSELHSYGEKIKQINMEINKKVFALSSLLQIGNLITTSANLDEVFQLIVDKLSQLERSGAAFLLLQQNGQRELTMRAQANLDSELRGEIRVVAGRGLLGKVFSGGLSLVLDSQKRPKVISAASETILQMTNVIALPINCTGKIVGILGTANNLDDFSFTDDEIELVGVFAKQVAVALENATLLRKTKELTVQDELTGLYNENYLRSRLDEEIKRAISYQRPCSLAILELGNFSQYRKALGEIAAQQALKKVAQTIQQSTSDIDKVARFSEHQFAVIFPEKNKRQAQAPVANIIKEIERYTASQNQPASEIILTLSVGISAAPIDGATSIELINKALKGVKDNGKNG